MKKDQEEIYALIEKNMKGINLLSALYTIPDGWLSLAELPEGKRLIAVVKKQCPAFNFFKTEREFKEGALFIKVLELNANNAALVRRFVNWAGPVALERKSMTIGFCDWFSNSTKSLLPLLAKQNIRPLLAEVTKKASVTSGQNFLEIMDAVTWSVLENGYQDGYGAAALDLNEEEDIVKVLLYGYSMIGFDCSDKINYEIDSMSEEMVAKEYLQLPVEFREAMEESYVDGILKLSNGHILNYAADNLRRIVLKYGEFIMRVQSLYNSYLLNTPWEINFALSMVAAGKSLTLEEHYLVGHELIRNKVKIALVKMPQSGTWDLQECSGHAEVAEACGYRLSFDYEKSLQEILPEVLKCTNRNLHINITSLLCEATLQVIELTDQVLYKKIIAVDKVELGLLINKNKGFKREITDVLAREQALYEKVLVKLWEEQKLL
ncbi:MAG TPA: hypothetical protein IAB06_08085 [Candidatus Avacidaminococcus intestinavium]|uniref:Uncharacterized protein n=1 Tax=Candidatus Avacidaminococcus intestinavium TaxID=2840684 RepID=A0A9D1SMD5_9FIRM|nr:hypothetical protein [Candidatus Avacidaminococcus intestinavium]